MSRRRWLEPILMILGALLVFIVALMSLLALTGCASGSARPEVCPPCPPRPTPSFVDRPVMQPYPHITVPPRPSCDAPPTPEVCEADPGSCLDLVRRCYLRVLEWSEQLFHELTAVEASRLPDPTPSARPTPPPGPSQ